MGTLRSDLTYLMRATRRRPATALLCVLTLSLGVGASTAMFSVVESVLLRPLPYPEPERLVSVYPGWPSMRGHPTLGFGAERGTWSWPEYFGVEARQTVFEAMAAYSDNSMVLSGDGPPQELHVFSTTWRLFPMLGATPVVGRLFDAGDTRESQVVVLSHGQWESAYGSDPEVVGRRVTLDDDSYVVLGVLPEGFEVDGESPTMWTVRTGSLAVGNIDDHGRTRSVARLAHGVTLDRARDEVTRIFEEILPADHGEHIGSVFPRQEDETRLARPAILVMFGSSILLLLVACGSTTALLLGAGIDRERELALRGAVGASRGRLIIQLLTESTALGIVAALGGVVAAAAFFALLLLVAPAGIPGLQEASLSGSVLAFAVLTAAACGVASGMVPALGLSSVHLAGAMGSARSTVKARARLQSTVVVGEVALAALLIVSAMLLTRTVGALSRIEPGFDVERLATVAIAPPSQRFVDEEGNSDTRARAAYQRDMREAIAAIPGVDAVAVASSPPLMGFRANNSVVPEGWDPSRTPPVAERRYVSDDFFEAAGIRMVEGRSFEPQDYADGAMNVVIVSEGLAGLGWPNGSPLGSTLTYFGAEEAVVVGVAASVNDEDLRAPTPLAFYLPGEEGRFAVSNALVVLPLMIRASEDPAALLPSIRERIWTVDPNVPILQATTLLDLVADEISEENYRARLMAIFAAFAGLLALMGIYGVTSRSVARRAREMGIRLALGARKVSVHRMVTLHAVRLGVYGVVAGIALALAGARVLQNFIWGVSVTDPLTLITVLLVLPAFAALAALGPARRATRVDPLEVLKAE
jgi:predicted permease